MTCNTYSLTKHQTILYDALNELNKICLEDGLKIYLRGGSVLGAVKYEGFIPWDDDIDIALPRYDYERLISLTKGLIIAGKYIIHSYRYNSDLHCYFPRLFLTEEERIRQGMPKNTDIGLHLIDILPLDGAPGNAICRAIYFVKVYLLRVLASLGTTYKDEQVDMHKGYQKLIINILRALKINAIIKQRRVYEILEKVYTRYPLDSSLYAGTITASLYSKEVMPKDIWGDGIQRKFGDSFYFVPSHYDFYLKRLYGNNYLSEEPPENKRKSHLQ